MDSFRDKNDYPDMFSYNVIREAFWFSKEKEVYQKELDRLKTNYIVRKGIYKCPRCLNNKQDPNNTESEIRQTSSGDEILTIQNTCGSCGLIWRL
jgi:DNA-directed RNA polymerase subunit M/transcription elongation factor TFIIS